MKKLYSMLLGIFLSAGFTACNQPQTNSKSETSNAPIKVETPQRAQGQTDVLNLTTNKLDTVRVGIIGLGMRGYSAVERYMHIEGAKITALCDIRPEMVEKAQQVIEKQVAHVCRNTLAVRMLGKPFVNALMLILFI